MSARKTSIQLITKVGIGLAALCVVGVLLAAIPNHHAPAVAMVGEKAEQDAQSPDKLRTSVVSPKYRAKVQSPQGLKPNSFCGHYAGAEAPASEREMQGASETGH